jgi:DNA polymerase-1
MRDWAHLLLAEAETSRRVQQIDILASYPIYTPDGALAKPGWNPGNVYYDEPESLRGLKPDPSRARDILEDLIVDFPFRDEASRQNFYGLLLTPIVRPMLRGHTPMHLVGASLPRTGKSLLTEQVLGGLLYGRATPARQLVGDEGEVEKRILAMLLCGETIINLDNLKEYLDSPSLAMLLTAETFGGRVLGLSVDAMVKNILTIVATGNNVRATGEIAKRIVPIVLQPKTDEPERRDDFVYEDLPRHVRESRRVVLEVLLGMVEAWIAAGRPRGSVRLGGFEQWAAPRTPRARTLALSRRRGGRSSGRIAWRRPNSRTSRTRSGCFSRYWLKAEPSAPS